MLRLQTMKKEETNPNTRESRSDGDIKCGTQLGKGPVLGFRGQQH